MALKKKSHRHERIVQLVLDQGSISVGALAERLDVSTQTIRRDLDELACDGRLRRLHGRLELAEGRLNTPFDQRAGTNLAAKRAIGAAAAALIPDGSTIFISIGSTALAVAQALRHRKGLTIITNNLSVAMALSDEMSNRIILPGGEVRLPDRDLLGDEVVDFLNRYRAEFCIFGVAGIAEDGSLLEFHSAENRAREAFIRNALCSILVTDRSKFGRLAPAAAGNIMEVDRVVLDALPSDPFTALLDGARGDVVLAEPEVAA